MNTGFSIHFPCRTTHDAPSKFDYFSEAPPVSWELLFLRISLRALDRIVLKYSIVSSGLQAAGAFENSIIS